MTLNKDSYEPGCLHQRIRDALSKWPMNVEDLILHLEVGNPRAVQDALFDLDEWAEITLTSDRKWCLLY